MQLRDVGYELPQMLVQALNDALRDVPIVDRSTGVLVGPEGTEVVRRIIKSQRTAPYRAFVWGDSRSKVLGSTQYVATTTGEVFIYNQTFSRVIGHLGGDTWIVADFGLDGDRAANWAVTNRTNSKTYVNAGGVQADLCYVQYGINDIISWVEGGGANVYATFRDTLIANLKAVCNEMLKRGVMVLFEEIYPCTATDSGGYGANSVKKHQMRGEVNAAIRAWIAAMPAMARFASFSSLLQDGNGYAITDYFDAAGVHLNVAGARIQGRETAAVVRQLLPAKGAIVYTTGGSTPNLVDWPPASVTTSTAVGTSTGVAVSNGYDDKGFYVQVVWTPATLSSGLHRIDIQLHANVGSYSGASPKYTVAASDVLVGSARLVVDDATGGVPSLVNNASLYLTKVNNSAVALNAAWGSNTAITTVAPALAAFVLDETATTPLLTLDDGSSTIEAPANGKGLYLRASVFSLATGAPQRIRIYNPSITKIN